MAAFLYTGNPTPIFYQIIGVLANQVRFLPVISAKDQNWAACVSVVYEFR